MKRLFEIPIYALSPLKLDARVSKHILKVKKLLTQSNNDIAAQIIDGETFPMRSWDYNHIIGYIRITASKTDILFDVFMPVPLPERYIWNTTKRLNFQDICANGAHIYHGMLKTNTEIRKAVSDMLDQVIIDHIPSRFYVDKDAFETTNRYLNYQGIIQEMGSHPQ